jgi:membrane associated rhomboid family serine protease
MTTAPDNPDNYCYRHPGRQSFVLCQRCGRTICPECQVQAPVGVHCVECARQDQRSMPRPNRGRPEFVRAMSRPGAPVMTYTLIGICVLVYILQLIPGLGVTNAFIYAPLYTQPDTGAPFEPWRMITSMFIHSPITGGNVTAIFHLLLNMYTLFIFGPLIERMVGRWRFLALYMIAGFGGSVGVDLLAGPTTAVLGASGAIFGLMGAFFVINRHLGGSSAQIIVLVVLNLAIGFFLPGIAWQAHLGGLIAGGLVGLVYVRTRNRNQRGIQVLLVAAVAVGLIVVTAIRALI